MPSPEPAEPTPRVRTYRQGSALVGGGVLAVLAAVFLLLYAIDGFPSGAPPALWSLVAGLLVWAVLLRPSVQLSERGVTLRNIARDVQLSWAAIDLVEARWALTLVTGTGDAYSSWAISAQRPRRAPRPGARGQGMDVLAGLGAGRGDPDVPLEQREASAGGVGEAIRRTREQYDDAVARGAMAAQAPVVAVTPAYPSLAALGLAVLLAGLAVVL